MNKDLTSFIVKELRRHHERKAIIERVCERSTLHPKDAERLIILIEAQQKRTIAVQKTPRLFFLSIGALLLGVVLLAINLQTIFGFWGQDVSLQINFYKDIELIAGVVMSIAGAISLWKAFGRIFPE